MCIYIYIYIFIICIWPLQTLPGLNDRFDFCCKKLVLGDQRTPLHYVVASADGDACSAMVAGGLPHGLGVLCRVVACCASAEHPVVASSD